MRVEPTRARGTRRSRLGCGAALLTGSAVVFLVSFVSAVLFVLSPGGNDAAASFIRPQPGSVRWDGHERLNVLLLGLDRQSGESAQADALLVLSFDPQQHTVRTLGIPGDIWLTLPGFGPGRLSEAYRDGGARLAERVVENMTHVPIQYYAALDSDTFRQIIDALGGVSIEAPRVVTLLRRSVTGRTFHTARVVNGRLHMNGAAVLRFVQVGPAGATGDVRRLRREQQILIALKRDALQSQTFFRIPTIVNTLGGSVATNFPYDQVPMLARALISVPDTRMAGAVLDYSHGAVTDYGGDGEHVLLPDWQEIRSVAQAMLSDPSLEKATGLEVLNGSGMNGEAASLAGWLQQSGVPIAGYSSAPRDYAHTQVVVARASSPADRHAARMVATLLQAPLISSRAGQRQARIIVIIGHDFQDPNPQ